jgi:hypothetical protein
LKKKKKEKMKNKNKKEKRRRRKQEGQKKPCWVTLGAKSSWVGFFSTTKGEEEEKQGGTRKSLLNYSWH